MTRAQEAMFLASGIMEPRGLDEARKLPAARQAEWWWQRVAAVWEQRARVSEAHAARVESELGAVREENRRLSRALDDLAGPAR